MMYKFIMDTATDNSQQEEVNVLQEEMDFYQDILTLNTENMHHGKTFEFFKTIAEQTEYQDVDFVMKAEDDTYLHLDRDQYDLAHTNCNMAYWGYLVGDTFMAGQCYGLCMDLVKWVAANSAVVPTKKKYKAGETQKNASQVQKWFQKSKINDQIKYEVRNCKMHDYIDATSTFSREIDTNSSMVVHYLKKDHHFMRTHYTLAKTYVRR